MTKQLLWALLALTMMTLPWQAARGAEADRPFLHPLFTDNMVLQRDVMAPVWGWTAPGQQVTVSMGGKSATATADATGKWLAKIGPFAAGGPFTLTVAGPQTVTLNNVMAGDVWICSGQSNMQMGIGAINAPADVAAADYPNIRLFTVPNVTALTPQDTVKGHWDVCTPQTVVQSGWGGFSAVAYFFGKNLHENLNVPIGLIHTSWGGTIAEAWTSGAALKTMPDFADVVAQIERTAADQGAGDAEGKFQQQMAEWWAKNDPGSAPGQSWSAPQADAAAWKAMPLPQKWEDSGLAEFNEFDGIAWFRKEFEAPAEWAGKELTLRLGPIDDRDTTWVNGVPVGAKDDWMAPRDYKVPAGVVKTGRNVIAVRVLDTGGGGGIYGKPEDMKIEAPGAAALPLSGEWRYRIGAPLNKLTAAPQRVGNNPNVVTVLYNAMIAPLVPFAIKGAIWYQGESNAGRGEQYSRLLPTLIKDWRARFGVGDFPFLIVQLAGFMAQDTEPRDDSWPQLRDAQLQTTKTVPNTALATAIDIGEANDIHPKNKQDVGKRLALAALGIAYGQKIEYSGPLYRAMKVEGNKVRLSFDHLGGGLEVKGDKLQGFAIAGEDKHFVWADAVVDGDTVVVSSPQVPNPVAVRYAWANNPVANLTNKAGLPAVPFRTDK